MYQTGIRSCTYIHTKTTSLSARVRRYLQFVCHQHTSLQIINRQTSKWRDKETRTSHVATEEVSIAVAPETDNIAYGAQDPIPTDVRPGSGDNLLLYCCRPRNKNAIHDRSMIRKQEDVESSQISKSLHQTWRNVPTRKLREPVACKLKQGCHRDLTTIAHKT